MLIDELGSSTHPHINKEIVSVFQNPETNPNFAQLVFSSHDTTLLRRGVLRRDQVWYTEMMPDRSTALYSLSDFKPRGDLAVDRAYLDGRFGAVPFIETNDEIVEASR